MENISFGGRMVAGFPIDQSAVIRDSPFFRDRCGLDGPDSGVRIPPVLAGIGAGIGVGALAHFLCAPTWGTAVSGVGTALGVWGALR